MKIESYPETVDATCALFDWFESQEIQARDALVVMGLAVTAIINGTPGLRTRQRRREAARFVATLRASLALTEDEQE